MYVARLIKYVYSIDASFVEICFVGSGQVRVFFFFQAEDGIRDYKVTGVQTCALPIFGVLPKIGLRLAPNVTRQLSRSGCLATRAVGMMPMSVRPSRTSAMTSPIVGC